MFTVISSSSQTLQQCQQQYGLHLPENKMAVASREKKSAGQMLEAGSS